MTTNMELNRLAGQDYSGVILAGDFSRELKGRVADCIARFRSFEEIGNPAFAYLSAWWEHKEPIWYEFISDRFVNLLGCKTETVADFLRNKIIERREYKYMDGKASIAQEIIDRRELDLSKVAMREAVEKLGTVEAVYKVALDDGQTIWVKDQAVIESYTEDSIILSLGCLTVVSKEMEAEEELNLAQKELTRYRDHLEDLVKERNVELMKTNKQLKKEIHERKAAEISLMVQSQHLEEVNTALKVLLKQREGDKKALEEVVVSNVRELINPYIEKLAKCRLGENQRTLLGILESNLNNIVSPFINNISSKILNFTPMEIKIANLVREGKTNKEIAGVLFLSVNTVLVHRHHIRTKLGIKNKKTNLRSHLLSLNS
ncbi:MAG: LuxR C-terminal-related transcriptional regulator [Desulfobacteraceae bacterium]|nr:LuxR C-terminal-related transcriptional regulator [Desulfobacteraceae bacterium]